MDARNTGIGRGVAERTFYRALTVCMIPSETLAQACAHTIEAAIDLFGRRRPADSAAHARADTARPPGGH